MSTVSMLVNARNSMDTWTFILFIFVYLAVNAARFTVKKLVELGVSGGDIFTMIHLGCMTCPSLSVAVTVKFSFPGPRGVIDDV
ncbi:MAG: hypothetical protein ACTSXC_02035 [Candidatus Freyarchaeota archaeon]